MAYEPSENLDPGMIAFPDAQFVFARDAAAHRAVLQPLLSIEASMIDPNWNGKLHFVTPFEPYDGLLGSDTKAFHSGYCTENWIAFRVRDSKYEFMGDFRYFRINAEPSDFLRADYAEKEKSYLETAKLFRVDGRLHPPGNRRISVEWVYDLGGDSEEGNWTAFGLPVERPDGDEGATAYPLTHDGRRFRYVGCLTGFSYRKNCADGLLLFYDPKESIAVMTFEWT
jgi:hypothetical protein